jgi:tetratricopeptide (TPR) repeat protein
MTMRLIRTVHGQGFRIETQGSVDAAPLMPASDERESRAAGALTFPALSSPAKSGRGDLERRLRWAALALVLVCASAALWRGPFAWHGSHVPPEAAHRLYLKGMQDWAQRTPASLAAAAEEFGSAVRIDPDYADAYVGLANTYNLLREYAGMPDAQAFSLAKPAAEHALRLNPNLASAHAAHAFVLFWGDWDFPAAIAEYRRALQLEPDNPGIHHWLATSLDNVGDHGEALAHIDRALELSPESRSIKADRAIILFHMGHADEARAALANLAATDPEFASSHAYLAEIDLAIGDDAGFLSEGARFAQVTHRAATAAIVAAAAAGRRIGGHAGMIRGLLAARLAAFEAGTAEAADVAAAYALAGDRPAALRMLAQSIDRHELAATYMLNDPGLRLLVPDPAAAPLLARLHLHPEGAALASERM